MHLAMKKDGWHSEKISLYIIPTSWENWWKFNAKNTKWFSSSLEADYQLRPRHVRDFSKRGEGLKFGIQKRHTGLKMQKFKLLKFEKERCGATRFFFEKRATGRAIFFFLSAPQARIFFSDAAQTRIFFSDARFLFFLKRVDLKKKSLRRRDSSC